MAVEGAVAGVGVTPGPATGESVEAKTRTKVEKELWASREIQT